VAGLGEVQDISLFHDVDSEEALQVVGLRDCELLFENPAEVVDVDWSVAAMAKSSTWTQNMIFLELGPSL